MLVGVLTGGYLSDRYGRRKIVAVGLIIGAITSLIVVFPKRFIVFIVCRLIFGFGRGTASSIYFPRANGASHHSGRGGGGSTGRGLLLISLG